MHLPSLSQLFTAAAFYVAGSSIVVNVLPKETFLDGYPRAKKAYRTGVALVATSAINLRKRLPSLDLRIPGLGFDQYEHDHPELFAESVTESVTASTTHTVITAAASEPLAASTPTPSSADSSH
jgi:hypothetical protein